MSHESNRKHKAFLVGLSSINGIGHKTIFKILKVCQKRQFSDQEFWDNKNHIWQEMFLSEKIVESIKKFKKEHNLLDNLSSLEASGIQILTFEEKAYPTLLLATEDFPIVLFVKSRLKLVSLLGKTLLLKQFP